MSGLGKKELLKELATHGYNVGFGAKKSYASYDIINKIPGLISLIGLIIGIGQLAYPNSPFNTGISTILIIASIIGMSISPYDHAKETYNQKGEEMTRLFNRLRLVYLKVKSAEEDTYFVAEEKEIKDIMDQFYEITMSNQIFGSDWYAHYKFFRQMQIGWIDEQLKFKFWKDKIPTSFIWFVAVILLSIPTWIYIFKGELPFVG